MNAYYWIKYALHSCAVIEQCCVPIFLQKLRTIRRIQMSEYHNSNIYTFFRRRHVFQSQIRYTIFWLSSFARLYCAKSARFACKTVHLFVANYFLFLPCLFITSSMTNVAMCDCRIMYVLYIYALWMWTIGNCRSYCTEYLNASLIDVGEIVLTKFVVGWIVEC